MARASKRQRAIPPNVEPFWEDYAILIIRQNDAVDWEAQKDLWKRLPLHTPEVARRILFAAISTCCARGEALPSFMLPIIEKVFEVPTRRGLRKPDQFACALAQVESDQRISVKKLAKITGVSRPTAADWKKRILAAGISDLPEYED
jgi:hypothetical protein